MAYDRDDQDRKVISLTERYDSRVTTKSIERPFPPRQDSRDALSRALDALVVAQFELCGDHPHPTRASLSEMRFRQAREALENGITLLRTAIEETGIAPSVDERQRSVDRAQHLVDIHAAD
jgi:hypothetical protein